MTGRPRVLCVVGAVLQQPLLTATAIPRTERRPSRHPSPLTPTQCKRTPKPTRRPAASPKCRRARLPASLPSPRPPASYTGGQPRSSYPIFHSLASDRKLQCLRIPPTATSASAPVCRLIRPAIHWPTPDGATRRDSRVAPHHGGPLIPTYSFVKSPQSQGPAATAWLEQGVLPAPRHFRRASRAPWAAPLVTRGGSPAPSASLPPAARNLCVCR